MFSVRLPARSTKTGIDLFVDDFVQADTLNREPPFSTGNGTQTVPEDDCVQDGRHSLTLLCRVPAKSPGCI